MALKTSLVISGDSASATAALRDVEQGLNKAGTAATRSSAQIRSAANDVERSANRQAFAVRNAGQQVGDFGLQIADGTSISRAFSNQIGQLGFALSEMGGKAGKVGAALTGPVGIGFTIAAALAAPFVEKLFQAGEAAEAAKLGTDALAQAQGVLGGVFDLVSGKLNKQNELLLLNARLTAINLRGESLREAASSKSTFANLRTAGNFGFGNGRNFGNEVGAAGSTLIAAVRSGKLSTDEALKRSENIDLSGSVVTAQQFQQAIIDEASARAKASIAANIDTALNTGRLPAALRRPGPSRSARAAPKGPSPASLASAGLGIADRIADIEAQYSTLPTAIKKSNDQLRELEKIKAAIDAKPLLPGADALRARIAAIGITIQNSINKPFDDYLEQQRQSAEIDKLLVQGRNDEAAALQAVIALQKQMGPLNDDQLQSVLASIQARRVEGLLLRDQQALIQGNVEAVRSFRGALEQTVADALQGRFSVGAILKSLGNSAINLASQRIVEQLFGNTLRSLEAQAAGGNKVDTAATTFTDSLNFKASPAVTDFATTVRNAIARIDGTPAPAANDNSAPGGTVDDRFGLSSLRDIVVTAPSRRGLAGQGLAGQGVAEQLINIVGGTLGALKGGLPVVIGQALKSTLGKLEKSLPSALQGAFTGATASRVILGDKGTGGTIGSSIGGAIGQKVGEKFLSTGLSAISKGLGSFAGPLGAIAGGLIGGLLGGLFEKAKFGTASVSNKGTGPVVGGNDSKAKSNASSLGDAVQSGIQQIADQLGAQIGDYNVSIGTFKDNFRVSTTGFTGSLDSKKAKGQGLVDFGKDGQDKAIAFAIADAIADGAILGVTPKVAAALKSSPDINKALAEALKTADLELALGGVGAQLAKEFKTFERTAADRLRIAKAYGFDILKVEELNAKQRLALNEKLLKDQVGSIQNLIDELTTGSLFEGSAIDQRTALLGKIDAARADANAGVEGAADKLAGLLEKLNSVSRDAFATTAGFAADRQLILDVSRDVIAKNNQRVADAQKASDPALQKTNDLLNEQAAQNAQLVSQGQEEIDLLKKIAASVGGSGVDLDSLRFAASF